MAPIIKKELVAIEGRPDVMVTTVVPSTKALPVTLTPAEQRVVLIALQVARLDVQSRTGGLTLIPLDQASLDVIDAITAKIQVEANKNDGA